MTVQYATLPETLRGYNKQREIILSALLRPVFYNPQVYIHVFFPALCKETAVPGQWTSETLRFGNKQVDENQIAIAKRL